MDLEARSGRLLKTYKLRKHFFLKGRKRLHVFLAVHEFSFTVIQVDTLDFS